MKNIFTFLFILFTINVAGQNLVVNPSFELYNPCPTGTSQINNATGWTATNYFPEFYHACATQASQVSIPTNVCGYQYPATGNGCMAALCYGSFASSLIANFRECSTGTLTQPLVVGNNYHVSLKVVLMNAASHSCDHIGALFTVGYKATQSITNFAHVYGTTQISDTLNWTEISGTFVADSAYVGTIGTIIQLLKHPDGTVKVLVEGKRRVKIKDFVPNENFFVVKYEGIPEEVDSPS